MLMKSRCAQALQSLVLILIVFGLSRPGGAQWAGAPAPARVGAVKTPVSWVAIPGVVDGLTAYALYWKPAQPFGRAVIMLWGSWNLSVSDMLTNAGAGTLIQKFLDSGYAVLAVDPRGASGHGELYESLFDIGTDEVFDVISGAWWLKAESAPRLLFLVGVSHGGSLALRSAEELIGYGLPVDGVWAFGPITDYQAWMDWACAKQLRRCLFLQNWNADQRYQGSPIHFYSKRLGPVFLVHGSQDSVVPVEQSRAWVKIDPRATLFEQPIDHIGLLNDASIQQGLRWMNRIAQKKRR
jgi:acetyl esterase/lipase